MSLKKIEQVKKDKGFKVLDLIIYGAVLLVVAVLFIVIFSTHNTDPLSGVKIYVNAQEVFAYEFGGVPTNSGRAEVEEDNKGITVTIRSEDGDLNVIYIDKSEKSVKMIETNCRGQQCLYFPAIDNNSKFIYCNPHGLKIEPYFRDFDNPNIPF